MQYIILRGIVGIALSQLCLTQSSTATDYQQLDVDGGILMEESLVVERENAEIPVESQDLDLPDHMDVQPSTVFPHCLAQIVGKTRLLLDDKNCDTQDKKDEQHCHIISNFVSGAAGLSMLFTGAFSCPAFSPATLGLAISGAIIATPFTCATLSEIIYYGAWGLGKNDFVQQADDSKSLNCCMTDWSTHLGQGSRGAGECLSWFFTPCCGPTTDNEHGD